MKKEFAGAEGFMIPRPAGHVLSDVGVDQPGPLGLKSTKASRIFALPSRRALTSVPWRTMPGLQSLEQVVVVGGGAVLGDDLLLLPSLGLLEDLLGGFARFRRGLGHSLILCDCEIKC